MILRPYQDRAVRELSAAFESGKRRVVLVAPPGAGKGSLAAFLLAESARRGERGLFLVHRREIVLDIANRVRALAPDDVGVILAGHDAEPYARIQVASVQTVLARESPPAADIVVADECHHYRSSDWGSVLAAYPDARVVGFTATPERADGQALGDVFESLIVVAHYSELLADGHLVQCRVFQPPEALGRNLAQEPLAAYQKIAPGSRAFLFVGGVRYAEEQAAAFSAAGVPTAAIHANVPAAVRDQALQRFKDGDLRVLANYGVYTEGTDVPEASTIILARACQHASVYLQITGRGLRPHPSKDHAILIDLTGASLRHGLPTVDRHYSLTGRAIADSGAPLCVCQQCGLTFAGLPPCPGCGYIAPREAPPPPRIYSLELREVYAGVDTPDAAKDREWQRLRTLCQEKAWSLGWAVGEYRKLFGDLLPVGFTEDDRRAVYSGFLRRAGEKGYKEGWAKYRYREMFGCWPRFGRAA